MFCGAGERCHRSRLPKAVQAGDERCLEPKSSIWAGPNTRAKARDPCFLRRQKVLLIQIIDRAQFRFSGHFPSRQLEEKVGLLEFG
jgi:hypothetical protein